MFAQKQKLLCSIISPPLSSERLNKTHPGVTNNWSASWHENIRVAAFLVTSILRAIYGFVTSIFQKPAQVSKQSQNRSMKSCGFFFVAKAIACIRRVV